VAESSRAGEFVAECFLPGVDEEAARALDARAATCAAELTRGGEPVRYLGSLLMRADEVLLCLFEGPEQAVRQAVERAAIPCERIVEATRSPWPVTKTA
jgi:hypothetical protein